MGKHYASLWVILFHFILVCFFLGRNLQKNIAMYVGEVLTITNMPPGQKMQTTFDKSPKSMLSAKLLVLQSKLKATLPSMFHGCEIRVSELLGSPP